MRRAAIVLSALSLGACTSSRPRLGGERGDGAAPAVVTVERAPAPRTPFGLTQAKDEREPNDDLGRAQVIELVPSGIRGSLWVPAGTKRGDIDYFRWPPGSPTRQIGRVELGVPAAARASLEALDGEGRVLAAATTGGEGDVIVLPNLAIEPAEIYFLRIRAATPGPHDYQLSAQASAPLSHEEIEPNDSTETANPLFIGADFSGYYGRRHDEEYFRLSPEEAMSDAALRVDLSAVDRVAPTLRLIGSDGRTLVEARGKKGAAVMIRQGPVGALWALVRAESGFNTEYRWTLRVTLEPRTRDGG